MDHFPERNEVDVAVDEPHAGLISERLAVQVLDGFVIAGPALA
jgi:hypothetical protein